MTAIKRPAHKPLPPIPLSELPMMKALLAIPTPPDGGETTTRSNPAIKDDPKTQLMMLTRKIIDKVQVLALRRPHALLNIAQVLDNLLDQHLEVLEDGEHRDRSPND